ncbi:MAG: ATP-binding cassette domain-containing protein [Bacteroidia bacterium]|nr:ATP-binding cassette domain-containing protein [Bacteroidia bacterium]MDW8133755.1 ATP-binding cassette domain-containing protein [Bacteroidia bacterium]
MRVYLQALSEFYKQEYVGTAQEGMIWPRSYDALQEYLGEANLIAFSHAFSREVLFEYLQARRLPLILVRRDWGQFYLTIPTEGIEWYLWRDERFLGRFRPEELLQKGLGEDAYMYIVVPRGFYPSPFSAEITKPLGKLTRLFSAESRIVAYIYLYAAVSGGANFLVPVIVQAIYTYIQTLQWVTGLTTLIILAGFVLTTAALVRIGQYILIEHLQRRLFLHSTLEIVYHVPRWVFPAVIRENLPALINRYFEIFTLEKNLAKLLLNVPADLLTILFGVILLSVYAEALAFSILILTAIVGVFLYLTFSPTYHKKKAVSDEKYRMASWLEELARALLTFKVAGFPPILYRRTQELEERYLTARQRYFRLILVQKGLLFFYQVAIALIMLIAGAWLVIEKDISLGQFVASELVLFLILGAVQDLVGNLEALYDAIVGMDKLTQIFTPPHEKLSGIALPSSKPFSISMRDVTLNFKRGYSTHLVLRNVSLEIAAGEKICITGPAGSGKSTLLYLLYGLYRDYEGDIHISGIDLRQIDLLYLRSRIGDALEAGEIIEARVWDNLTLGTANVSWEEVMHVCNRLGLKESIEKLPEGFFTVLPPQGRGILSEIDQRKLILARALLTKPSLLFVDDIFATIEWSQKASIYELILSPEMPYTALVVSREPQVMQMCDKVAFFYEGELRYFGPYMGLSASLKVQQLSLPL